MAQVDTARRLDLREYLNILRDRKITIIAVALLVTAIGLFFSYRQTPLYSSTARVLVQSLPGPRFVDPLNMETESQLAASVPVAELVVEDLDLTVTPEQLLASTGVTAIEETEVLTVTHTSPDPVFSQEVANSFAENYLAFRADRVLEEFEEAAAALEARIENVQSLLTGTQRQIDRATRANDASQVTALQARRSALEGQLSELQTRLGEVTPDESLREAAGDIIQAAAVPTTPSSPNHTKDAALAALMGLSLGIGVALLRERLDESFASRAELERVLEAPVLATIPRYSLSGKEGRVALTADSSGAASEAYRTLRTSVVYLADQQELKSLLVTSPSAGEGKTSTAVNLGVALSQVGKKVVLVSADLRRPAMETYFGITPTVGLTSWLTGEEEDLSRLLHWPTRGQGYVSGPPSEVAKGSDIAVLPSGPTAYNPSELLASPKLSELIRQLEQQFDMVLIDSPPVLPVTDAPLIGHQVGQCLIVVHSEGTTRNAASHAKQDLERMGVRVLGLVMNQLDPGGQTYYGGYATYYPVTEPGAANSGNGGGAFGRLKSRLGARR